MCFIYKGYIACRYQCGTRAFTLAHTSISDPCPECTILDTSKCQKPGGPVQVVSEMVDTGVDWICKECSEMRLPDILSRKRKAEDTRAHFDASPSTKVYRLTDENRPADVQKRFWDFAWDAN